MSNATAGAGAGAAGPPPTLGGGGPPPGAPSLDLLLGPMVIGTIISVFLSGIMVVQCYNYFVRFPKDPAWMKILVAYLFVLDMAHTIIESEIIYEYCVTFFGQFEKIVNATGTFAAIPVISVSISSPSQCFFAWRVIKLTGSKILGYSIALLAFVQFLCGIGVTIAITKVPAFFDFIKFQGVIIPWLSASVLCDLIITISLCFYLSSHRSGITRTDDLITRLIRGTIQTGLMTSIWAILDLIIYRTENNSAHLIFNLPLAKIYTNSLMSTLNARRAHVEFLNGGGEGAIGGRTGSGAGVVHVSGGIDMGNGIGKGSDGFTDTWGFKNPSKAGHTETFDGGIASTYSQTGHIKSKNAPKYTHTVKTHDIPLSPIGNNLQPHAHRGDPMDESVNNFRIDEEEDVDEGDSRPDTGDHSDVKYPIDDDVDRDERERRRKSSNRGVDESYISFR